MPSKWQTRSMASEQLDRCAQRARSALARAHELGERLTELKQGQKPNEASYEQAAHHAQEAVDNAGLALRQAAKAHHRAAEAHRRLADLLDSFGQPERAAQHRQFAEADDAAGDADEAASTDDDAS